MNYINVIERACNKKAIIDLQPMQAGDVVQTYANIEESERDLGYSPTTSIDIGIPRFVDLVYILPFLGTFLMKNRYCNYKASTPPFLIKEDNFCLSYSFSSFLAKLAASKLRFSPHSTGGDFLQ